MTTTLTQFSERVETLPMYRVGTAKELVLAILVIEYSGKTAQSWYRTEFDQEDKFWEQVDYMHHEHGKGPSVFVHPCRVLVSDRTNNDLTNKEIGEAYFYWLMTAHDKSKGELTEFGCLTIKAVCPLEVANNGSRVELHGDLPELIAAVNAQAMVRHLVGYFPKGTVKIYEEPYDGGTYHDMFVFFPFGMERALQMMMLFRDAATICTLPESMGNAFELIQEMHARGAFQRLEQLRLGFATNAMGALRRNFRYEIELGEDRAQDWQQYPYDLSLQMTPARLAEFDQVLAELLAGRDE